jgi:hypothetical protein
MSPRSSRTTPSAAWMRRRRVRGEALWSFGAAHLSILSDAKIEPLLESQFAAGRLYACISSRPGQSGRADGYILEGKELEVSTTFMSSLSLFVSDMRTVLPQEAPFRQEEARSRLKFRLVLSCILAIRSCFSSCRRDSEPSRNTSLRTNRYPCGHHLSPPSYVYAMSMTLVCLHYYSINEKRYGRSADIKMD